MRRTPMSRSLYLFTESRFPDRVKIGRCRDAAALDCLRHASSYSPATIACHAIWLFDDATPVETRIKAALRPYNAQLAHGGAEVYRLSAAAAVPMISALVGKAPDGVPAQLTARPDYDDLRHPPSRNLDTPANRRWRQVAWLYQEQGETARLKTSRINDWKTPLEPRKRYSFCGLKAVAAFSYAGPVSLEGNRQVDAAVSAVVAAFGSNTAPGHNHGWLAEAATVDEVKQLYRRHLNEIDIDPRQVPEGVRRAYNEA